MGSPSYDYYLDYGAPLKENGGVGEKYAAVKGIGEVVDKFGGLLVRSRPVRFDVQGADNLTIGIRRAADGTLFVFLLNRDKKTGIPSISQPDC